MPRMLELADRYSGRADGVVPVNFTIDREAAELLRQLAPSSRVRGRFISRLLYEHVARQEERQRVRAQLSEMLDMKVEDV
jgi:hypothetical protein